MRELLTELNLEVETYLDGKLKPAYFALQKEILGRGCGCRGCADARVEEFNSYLNIYTKGAYPELEYRVVVKNRNEGFEIE